MSYAKQMSESTKELTSSGWGVERSIVAYGVRVRIRSNNTRVVDSLLARIPEIWRPSLASVVERVFSLRVGTSGLRKNGRSWHQLYEDQQIIANSKDLDSALDTFERHLKIYLAEMARHRVFVHAGAVGWQGKGILVPGRSLSGKTSLVAELVRAGATYYSDEYAVLDKKGRVHPYPIPLGVREPGSYTQKSCCAEELGGIIGTKPLPVSLIVVSRYKPGEKWRPRELSPGQAMLEMLNNAIPVRRNPEAVIAILHKAVSEATTLKGPRGDATNTARRIFQYLNRTNNFARV